MTHFELRRLDHQLFRKLYRKWSSSAYLKQIQQFDRSSALVNRDELALNDKAPIIIVGMHRSGTSLLVDTLNQFGLFSGDVTGPDTSESLLFQYINDGVLAATQAHWSNPEPMASACANPIWLQSASSVAGQALQSRWRYLYRFRNAASTLKGEQGAFGWKDPRNCLTIPIWANLFPNAKWVFIYRHGVDVADSLVRREWRVGSSVYIGRCLSLDSAFNLWEEYNRQALMALQSIPELNQFRISFESLVDQPQDSLMALSRFCGLSPSQDQVERVESGYDRSKILLHRQWQDDSVYQSLLGSAVLAELGYS